MASRAPSTHDREVNQRSATQIFALLLGNMKLTSSCTFILLSEDGKMARVLLYVAVLCVSNYIGDLGTYSSGKV